MARLCEPEIRRVADGLIERRPGPVVEYRLRRDVLREDAGSLSMLAMRREVWASPGAIELAREQKPDGSWGRFHSMDSSIRARFVTSELAVERALAIGLDKVTPVLMRAAGYMTAVLRGDADWSDRREKSEAWDEGKKVITAATLSLIDPGNPETLPVWNLWARLAREVLSDGAHSVGRENAAFRRLTGVAFPKGYLFSRYVLSLLGSQGNRLSPDLSAQILRWVWARKDGIGYLCADMRCPNQTKLEPWIRSLELLSAFPGWREIGESAINWLWDARRPDGLWDFGRGMRTGWWFPLSDNWLPRGNRAIDHSTRLLILFRRYADEITA